MSAILPGLWLGSLNDAKELLSKNPENISAILTVETYPIRDIRLNKFKHLYIKADDTPNQNLLQHFESAISFIDESIKSGVLVHCAAGMSRSATIVIAYIMWKNRISYVKALKEVKKKRFVMPNEGFVVQLEQFERTNYEFPQKFGAESSKSPEVVSSTYYSCRKCRNHLFSSDQLETHFMKDGEKTTSKECNSGEIFTEHLDWMKDYTSEVQGKLYCSRCNAKIGSFNWCGEPCTCGQWVTPAFHFARSHLDAIPVTRNGVASRLVISKAGTTVTMPAVSH